MQQSVYADLYFLINTAMDLLCLMITASLLHVRVKRWRAIIAASLGGAYSVAALLLGGGGVLGFFSDCAVGILMCAITFATRRLTFARLLKCTVVQFFTSMLLGGIMTGLYALLNRLELPFEALEGDGLSVWLFALLSAAAGFATVTGGRFFGFAKRTKHVHVEATLLGKPLCFDAMVDTGNLLRDPISGRGVIVVKKELILPLLPPSLLLAVEADRPDAWLSDPAYVRYVRLIPAQTATGRAWLPALLPQALSVTEGRMTYIADYLIAPAELGDRAAGLDAVIPGN